MNKPQPNNTNQDTNGKDQKNLTLNDFQILRTKMWENGGVTFDMEINGIRIYGCRVVETAKGDFIGLPQRKGNDGKYYSIVFFKMRDEDQKIILAEVERKINGH